MRATSQIHATITALVAAARVALPAPFQVFDGPDVNGDDARDVMWIGLDDPAAVDFTAASGSARWASLGNNTRDEQFVVYAATSSWSGEENRTSDGAADVYRDLRARAFGNLAALETSIRTDPTVGAVLGGNGSTLRQIELQVVRVTPVQDEGGSAVVVQFQFVCWCRI